MIFDDLYASWKGIKRRCLNSDSRGFKYYGGRGITIYGPWIDDQVAFREYILLTIGPRPNGMTLDRIDNNGNYEPGNLRWATPSQQNLNRRSARPNEFDEKYIARRVNNTYRVCIRKPGGICIYNKTFTSLDTAISARDRVLSEINQE